MKLNQEFFVEGSYYGSLTRPLAQVEGSWVYPLSFAYFCPGCGRLWARFPVYAGENPTKWAPITKVCGKCPEEPSLSPRGSTWVEFSFGNLWKLSKEMIQKELEIYINFYEEQEINHD